MYNLHTRKKSQEAHIVQIELSINSITKRSHVIKKMTWLIYRSDDKKAKKYCKVEIEFSIDDNAKFHQIYN